MPGNILNTISDVLSFRRQRFVLNEQVSHWTSIEAAWPQGSILGTIIVFDYFNNLSDNLSTNANLFGGNASIFSIDRSGHPDVFCKNGFLKNYAKFMGKHLCHSFFFQ